YPKRKHVVVGSTEHHAVFEPAEYLHHHDGYDLDFLPVDVEGFASAEQLSELVRDNTAIVSVMHANNETGAIQELSTLTEVTRARDILFHTDAVQSIGKIVVDVKTLGVDLMSLTGHKIYGPKGTGALFVRQGVKIAPLFYGGAHEKKRRPGTENVAGAVGLARALEVAEKQREDDFIRLSKLADEFIDRVTETIPNSFVNSPRKRRIPQTVNMSFPGAEGESIILSLDLKGIAASSGSACTSGATEPSHVLTAMGIPLERGQAAVRFSLGRATTARHLDYVVEVLPPIIERLRAMSPTYRQTQA
ncbi:MAG: cysteine desulfurase, partial [candidate division Zixibacteria bacterium]|nr:cysteine desulfurase [candidate division Zixibacteria bacterium]